MFTTKNGDTTLEVKPCSCSAVPFNHVYLIFDSWAKIGPVLSKNMAKLALRRIADEEINMYEDDVIELEAFLAKLNLPENSPFDVAASAMQLVDEDDDDRPAQRQPSKPARFEICTCGRHGSILNSEGVDLYDIRTKGEGAEALDELEKDGEIDMLEKPRILSEILTSALPDGIAPRVQRRGVYFEVCPQCGEHGFIWQNGQPVSSPRSKHQGYAGAERLHREGAISLSEKKELHQQIEDSDMPEGYPDETENRELPSILGLLLSLFGGMAQQANSR